MDIQKEREAFERRQAKVLNMPYKELKARFDENFRLFGARYNIGSINEKEWNLWLEAWQAAKAQAVPNLSELQERIAGHQYYHDEHGHMIVDMDDVVKEISGFDSWKAQTVPEGFVLVKKRNMIGNPNVDWLQAPKWAKYWLKDGHSNKYWWSSIRPVKDMDINAFCWRGDYFAKEAPDFSFSGPWDKSLTSRKAMIEAQEPAND